MCMKFSRGLGYIRESIMSSAQGWKPRPLMQVKMRNTSSKDEKHCSVLAGLQ